MLIQLDGINKSFKAVKAVDGVSLNLRAQETLAIVGGSGSGKSTLAKIMAGLIKADSGQIRSNALVQMVFQDPYSSLDPMYPVKAILAEAFYRSPKTSPQEQLVLMQQVLAQVGLDNDILSRFPHAFSGGQRQRIAIARALLAKPAVLVLDEPTAALDVLVQRQVLDMLSALKAQLGLTYVFISHNLRVVKHFSDRIIVMQAGRIVEEGRSEDIFEKPAHEYTKQLLKAAANLSIESHVK